MISDHGSFTFSKEKGYGYFGKDFESYMRNKITDYSQKESEISGEKVLKAKVISENNLFKPDFVEDIAISLNLTKTGPAPVIEVVCDNISESADDIPF